MTPARQDHQALALHRVDQSIFLVDPFAHTLGMTQQLRLADPAYSPVPL
jgi:hypothetical protein